MSLKIDAIPVVNENNSFEFTIPIKVSISVGGASSAMRAQAGLESVVSDATIEAVSPDSDYENRPGFDTEFLGSTLPFPKATGSELGDVLVFDGGQTELKYHHYSVMMKKSRKLAFVSAVNYDAHAPAIFSREGRDKWFFDPRIPAEFQCGEELYVGNPLDRGHLSRRADAAWGNTAAEAKLGNDDTFHFTNCSPQHEVFNQSTKADSRGLLLWGNLENHVASQGRAMGKRLSVFNGPIFRKDDRPHRGVQIPRQFYKIIAYRNNRGALACAAFILSQAHEIEGLGLEAVAEFEIGEFGAFQRSVLEIQQLTSLDFGVLAQSDVLVGTGLEAPGAPALVLKSLNKIQL